MLQSLAFQSLFLCLLLCAGCVSISDSQASKGQGGPRNPAPPYGPMEVPPAPKVMGIKRTPNGVIVVLAMQRKSTPVAFKDRTTGFISVHHIKSSTTLPPFELDSAPQKCIHDFYEAMSPGFEGLLEIPVPDTSGKEWASSPGDAYTVDIKIYYKVANAGNEIPEEHLYYVLECVACP